MRSYVWRRRGSRQMRGLRQIREFSRMRGFSRVERSECCRNNKNRVRFGGKQDPLLRVVLLTNHFVVSRSCDTGKPALRILVKNLAQHSLRQSQSLRFLTPIRHRSAPR